VPNQGRVYFGLFGDNFDPDSLNIGVAPTETRRRGDPRPKYSSWILSGDKVVSDLIDVYAMSIAVVELLSPCEEKIVSAMTQHSLEAVLEVVLTISPDESVSTPVIGFDVGVISFLARVGASIDIDTYRGVS
jgi:hypothetical protein